ncbi:hypothetical protein O1611_g789 [Lasiodiplodia mahajangana]|uniref:Uncharacterized protein n=1 Tax=Lasiodiplodia mahajangana TaxID=1108764 RepID=A0ACC2K048_9PEZI|nr:hypothetical protein O1611_g789 [Lasiodiplodia mahajangana]
MAGRKTDHPPHCGTFWTLEMWQQASREDRSLVPRRQIPIALQEDDKELSARLIAVAAGLLHPPKVQILDELDDDTDEQTGSSIAVCVIAADSSTRLKKYLARDDRLVDLNGVSRCVERFDPYFEVHTPLIPDVKKPRVLVLSLMNTDDIFTTIGTIERLVTAMMQEDEMLREQSLIFNLIGGIKKTGPLALILARFRMDLQRSLQAFRYKQSSGQGEVLGKSLARDEYYAMPQWDKVECIDRDTPLRQDGWDDWDDFDEWEARCDRTHKGFSIIPHDDRTSVLRSYQPCESYPRANVSKFIDACEVALQWPEGKGVARLGKSVSDLSDAMEENVDSPPNSDWSGSTRSFGTTSSISPNSSFQNNFDDTDANPGPHQFGSDIDNLIFHAYREASTLWPDRNITLVTVGPMANTSDRQPLDFVSRQFRLMHKDLEKAGSLRYAWVNTRDPGQDFFRHAKAICSP